MWAVADVPPSIDIAAMLFAILNGLMEATCLLNSSSLIHHWPTDFIIPPLMETPALQIYPPTWFYSCAKAVVGAMEVLYTFTCRLLSISLEHSARFRLASHALRYRILYLLRQLVKWISFFLAFATNHILS